MRVVVVCGFRFAKSWLSPIRSVCGIVAVLRAPPGAPDAWPDDVVATWFVFVPAASSTHAAVVARTLFTSTLLFNRNRLLSDVGVDEIVERGDVVGPETVQVVV